MLDTLITSKTRVKLLMKFFLNPGTRAYLRELASEFGESTNSVRVELNRLSDAKIISSENVGRTIEYHANAKHSLYNELQSLVRKYAGV
ncbi:MAG: ArsR family transcriptional regulator, partial [SAR202 cluster bacterium]|nr:ArsR family transcriptional regulator [SAR202 cluster bacterium]